jgi:three-Cys-motif partner protein
MNNDTSVFKEPSNDNWGGSWTEKKIDIFVKYFKVYLEIMKKQNFKLVYFDGFAGSGTIETSDVYDNQIESVATRILSIDEPKSFDIYYLVELNSAKAERRREIVK